MTRNLVLSDPSENTWGMICRIGSIGDTQKFSISFFKTEEDARAAAQSIRERVDLPVNTQIFEYSYAKDELDLMKLMLIDGVDMAIKYLVG